MSSTPMEWNESRPLRLTFSLEIIHLNSCAYNDMASESRESDAYSFSNGKHI